MSIDTNHVVLVGRLTRDPEVKYTNQNKAVCKFSIAVNRGGQNDEVSFFDIVTWEKTADVCGKYLQKGSQVIVNGRLQQNRFQDKNGQNRSKVDIVANNVQFVGAKSSSQGGSQANSGEQYGNASQHTGGGFGGAPSGFDDFQNDPNDPF